MKRTDHTPLACLAIVAIAATLNLGNVIPPPEPPPVRESFIECWFFPWLSWCRPPDPPEIKPIVEPEPDPAPDCDFEGPCQ